MTILHRLAQMRNHKISTDRDGKNLRPSANKRLSQVTLELTLAMIVLMIFLYGATKIFIWCSKGLVGRHQYFEETRVAVTDYSTAAQPSTGTGVGYIMDYQPERLTIFPQDEIKTR